MSQSLDQRLSQLRSRLLIRSWEYRQQRHARGVWFRLRRVLAQASDAYVVSQTEAAALMAEGCRPEPVGSELDPPKLMLFARAERVSKLTSAEPVPVRLGAELLQAECIVLVPFD